MKLVSLQIFPNGKLGLGSDVLNMGRHITQLSGPTGSGKTPLVQSIVFCLGYPSVFRNEIYERCSHCVLSIQTSSGSNLEIKRKYAKEVNIEVTFSDGKKECFYNEQDYSEFIFELIGLKSKQLVSASNTLITPYLSCLLPIFYVDQDEGYVKVYCPPRTFIKDQFSEMIRIIFNLPEKNSFNLQKEKIRAKEALEYLDRDVEATSRRLNIAKDAMTSSQRQIGVVDREIERLEREVEELKNSGVTHDDSIGVLDRLISQHRNSIRDLTEEIFETQKRINSVAQIVGEINSEIDTLNLNEEARRVFLSFNEICGSQHCQLLSVSSESYTKNLLYLKDQIKDLERNAASDQLKIEKWRGKKESLELLIKAIVDERNSVVEKSEMATLIEIISRIKTEIFSLQSERSEIERITVMEARLLELLGLRDKALEKYQSYTGERNSIPMLVKLKSELRQALIKWFDTINISNVSYDIAFKDDFTPELGVESISQLKGSTRTKAILAYHAAIIELVVQYSKTRFKLLILDTPKQQEISNEDLGKYFSALKVICAEHDFQIIFSTTEYHYTGDSNDVEWNPKYPGKKHLMFLNSSQ